MKKIKLYNPDKCSSFKMMFGFEIPLKPKKKHEYKTYSQEAISSEGSPQR